MQTGSETAEYVLKTEIFKQVVGYSHYEVSNLGRIRTWWKGIKSYKTKRKEPFYLQLLTSSYGYKVINLQKDGVKKQHRVHMLVLGSFVGERPEGFFGCHKDDNKENNCLENLKWATPFENQDDRTRTGSRKIMNFEVYGIRKNLGLTHRKLAEKLGLTVTVIHRWETGKATPRRKNLEKLKELTQCVTL